MVSLISLREMIQEDVGKLKLALQGARDGRLFRFEWKTYNTGNEFSEEGKGSDQGLDFMKK